MLNTNQLQDISRQSFLDKLKANARQIFTPPPKLSLSQWADTYRMLSPESSAAAGRWRTDFAEYQREIMDTISDPYTQTVVVMAAAQTGKSETCIISPLLYAIHFNPKSILVVQPSILMAQSFSKDRLTPAMRDTKVVANLIGDSKGRDGTNAVLSKSFAGGVLNLAGANSAASLASRPCAMVLLDEIDRFPLSASSASGNAEGSPIELAIKRTSTYWNKKILMCSTPTDKSTSQIYARYQASDQRKYYIPCKHCGEKFVPIWAHVRWNKDDQGIHDPKSALLYCPNCGGGHTDTERRGQVRRGQWVKHAVSDVAGFHLSALISPWVQLDSLVVDWLAAQKDVSLLRVFINTALGEPFETESNSIDDLDLSARIEEYTPTSIPKKVLFLTAGVDTQNDRVEAVVYGHGHDREMWAVEHYVVHGSPAEKKTWDQLDGYLKTKFAREDGYILSIAAACIDSGGHHTSNVYQYCSDNFQRRIYAIKGRDGNLPIFPLRASKSGDNKHKVYIVGVDTAKERLYGQLRIEEQGAGYVHFPDTCSYDFFAQLTSEKQILKQKNGYTYYQWTKNPSVRNEILDCSVYAMAAAESLKINTKLLESQQQRKMGNAVNIENKAQVIAPIITQKDNDDMIRNAVQNQAMTKKPVAPWKQNFNKNTNSKWV